MEVNALPGGRNIPNIGGKFFWGNVFRTCDKSRYDKNYHWWLRFIFCFLEMVKNHRTQTRKQLLD